MKPELSMILTERAQHPFEIITMDLAEFEKKGESFICLGDKFSRAIHLASISKGGTSMEIIAAIVAFARSNVRNIRKITSNQGTQFTSEKYTEWVTKMNI